MVLKIPVDYNNKKITLNLIPEGGEASLKYIEDSEATEYGEAKYQLVEGCAYEYSISGNNKDLVFCLKEKNGIIKPSKIDQSRGRITPGIYVGTLIIDLIEIKDGSSNLIKKIPFEVRSIKQDYRNEYRQMLEEITDFCTEIVMQSNSPVIQNFNPDFSHDPRIIYQQFAFVKSIIDSQTFDNAIHRIINSPVTKWEIREHDSDIRRIKKVNSSITQQIISRPNRIKIENIPIISDKMETLPLRIKTTRKVDTNDTVENQFVKHALSVFYNFCATVKNKLKEESEEQKEAAYLENKIERILNRSFFKEISSPKIIPLNSPVLQRKDGYRELLQIWLKFDLASKLVWKGGDEVYSAGKRDVATLYQYWLFFKLLKLFSDIFSLDVENIEDLFIATSNGLNLKLKAGKHTIITGVYDSGVRKLKVEFHYNKTFSGDSEYPAGGSWTRNMIPDYTLSIWPSEFDKYEAEEQEIIVHIHFDSKYKIKDFKEILGNDIKNEVPVSDEIKGEYKRYDLIKMHAYKDAIRRTGGAYILYPGDKNKTYRGFHEIIPGLGAFAIRPSIGNDGTDELKNFVLKVIEHFLNRASQMERISYHKYDVYKYKNIDPVKESLPERYHQERSRPPDEESVLVGGCKSDEQYTWIENNGLYNVRTGQRRGSLRLEKMKTDASYLLIHKKGKLITGDIWEITRKGPRIFSKQKLLELNYPEPKHDFYLVYDVRKITDKRFGDSKWDIRKSHPYQSGRASFIPFAVTLTKLMQAKK